MQRNLIRSLLSPSALSPSTTMNHTAMAGTPATDKAEKTRQSLASLRSSPPSLP